MNIEHIHKMDGEQMHGKPTAKSLHNSRPNNFGKSR